MASLRKFGASTSFEDLSFTPPKKDRRSKSSLSILESASSPSAQASSSSPTPPSASSSSSSLSSALTSEPAPRKSKGKSTFWKLRTMHLKQGAALTEDRKKFNSLPRKAVRAMTQDDEGSQGSSSAPPSPDHIEVPRRLVSLFERPARSEENIKNLSQGEDTAGEKQYIKIECHEKIEGELTKEEKIFDVPSAILVEDLVKKACKRFCKWDDWRYGLYDIQNNIWLSNGCLADYRLPHRAVLHLKTKSADFFEVKAESEDVRSSGSLTSFMFSKSSIEQKRLKKGASYLSFILFNKEGELLLTGSQLLPSFLITREDESSTMLEVNSHDFLAVIKQAIEWENEDGRISETDDLSMEMATLSHSGFVKSFLEAVKRAKKELSLKNIGHVFEEPLHIQSLDVSLIVAIAYISSPEAYLDKIRRVSLKWSTIDKIDTDIYDTEWFIWRKFMQVHEGMRNKLDAGLYVGLFVTENTPAGVNVIVPIGYRQMCPVMRIRHQETISPEEWEFLTEKCKPQSKEEPIEQTLARAVEGEDVTEEIIKFQENFLANVQRLSRQTGIDFTMNEMYPSQVIQVNDSGTIQMIVFVRVVQMENEPIRFNTSLFTYYPIQLFQVIHQHVYKATSFSDFRRKSMRLESDIKQQTIAMRRMNDNNFDVYSTILKENERILKQEVQKWQASSWVFTIIDWYRGKFWSALYNRTQQAPA